MRAFALTLPGSAEEFPWGESVVKVGKKVFGFLGAGDGSHPPGINVKLKDPRLHEHALSVPGAQPSGHGPGGAGWVSVPLTGDAPAVEVLCDWVEESYRVVAPKRLVTELDAR
ncbi:MmcQ/YjbR family DNA-binding protein [Streptomyces sp. SID8377]|nr:MmcQ/YjbR family DNA-binding protein [Streptomyces sp. SID8377]